MNIDQDITFMRIFVGRKLRALRGPRSQTTMAALMRTTQSVISRHEAGTYAPTLDMLVRYARVHGCAVTSFFMNGDQ